MFTGILRSKSRRAVAAVVTVVSLPVMLGFAAFTVDVGMMYNARTDLQRAADSAALAAAAKMSEASMGTDPAAVLQGARDEAAQFVALNWVLGRSLTVDNSDVEFGRANLDPATGITNFAPTLLAPDAVRVRVRLSPDSPNGPMPLYFAGIFGRYETSVMGEAIAVTAPRDIAIVADMSSSLSDDSELSHYKLTTINLLELWDALPGGADEPGGGIWDVGAIPPAWLGTGQVAGPAWGYMEKLGFGTETVDPSYVPATDPGMVRLAYNANWVNANLRASMLARGYTTTEVNAMFARTYDVGGAYPYRVAVSLGLADWHSGIPGGRWSVVGAPPGDNNAQVASGEVQWTESLFGNSVADSSAVWMDYIDNYMTETWTSMYAANSDFRYRYGVKTFVNYLLERRPENHLTPEFANVPQQPMQAIKDATGVLTNFLTDIDSNDMLSLEIFASTAHHEIDLTDNFLEISDRLSTLQAGHYDQLTNTGGGLTKGIEELTSQRARLSSKKMIVLLSDGKANVNSSGAFGYPGGEAYALQMAQAAADQDMYIFTVGVGVDADMELMSQIAAIGKGQAFHAAGTIEEYSAELQQIFLTIAGLRMVQLVE